mmetsp:Transcript_43826/g.127606  ORF Transcript_43826/g.127606 Transcript_43826/m.127606 type:complete len:211 (-) Transcript_43826:1383-2015(-)
MRPGTRRNCCSASSALCSSAACMTALANCITAWASCSRPWTPTAGAMPTGRPSSWRNSAIQPSSSPWRRNGAIGSSASGRSTPPSTITSRQATRRRRSMPLCRLGSGTRRSSCWTRPPSERTPPSHCPSTRSSRAIMPLRASSIRPSGPLSSRAGRSGPSRCTSTPGILRRRIGSPRTRCRPTSARSCTLRWRRILSSRTSSPRQSSCTP